MSYRNYLAIIKKDDFKKITPEYIEQQKHEDGYLNISDLLKSLGAINVFELGKYSDEGIKLENKQPEILEDLKTAYNLVKNFADSHEYGFNLIKKDDFVEVINSYKKRTIEMWQDLLKENNFENEYDKRNRESRIVEYIQDKLKWNDIYMRIPENKYSVQNTWFYEYAIFDLVHILKIVDWDNYLMLVYGW